MAYHMVGHAFITKTMTYQLIDAHHQFKAFRSNGIGRLLSYLPRLERTAKGFRLAGVTEAEVLFFYPVWKQIGIKQRLMPDFYSPICMRIDNGVDAVEVLGFPSYRGNTLYFPLRKTLPRYKDFYVTIRPLGCQCGISTGSD